MGVFGDAHIGLRGGVEGTTLKDGLITVLELDETSGTTAFDSFGTNDFTNNGATINQSGIPNKSYLFDGVNDYLNNSSLSTELSNTNIVTVSLWVNMITVSTNDIIFEYSTSYAGNNAFGIIFTGSRLYVVQHTASGFNGTASDSSLSYSNWIGSWNNVIITLDRNQTDKDLQSTMWVNDVQQTFQIASNLVLNGNFGSYDTYIGARAGSSLFSNGNTSQPVIWNRVLTSDERALIVNGGLGRPYTQW